MVEELDVAIKACKAAGEVLKKHFRDAALQFTDKGNQNIVSEADLKADKVIIKTLNESFPDYAYYSEEDGFSKNSSENMWIIDPLDGTNNFALGISMFNVSIALFKNNILTLGVIYDPLLDDLVYAINGKGAFHNETKLTSRPKLTDKQTVGIITGYANSNNQYKVMDKVASKVRRQFVNWAPTVDFKLLAEGKIDSIISTEAESEDHIAGLLIAKEIGLVIKTFDGADFYPDKFERVLPNIIITKNLETFKEIKEMLD